jgi:putative ABC transport system substrate-binding protein
MQSDQLKRRDFVTLLGGTVALPIAAQAQQQALPLIGYLHVGASSESRDRVAAFHRGLKELDFVEGRNVAIEYRWADNQFDRLPELAGDLIRRGVAVIAAPAGADTTRVVKGLTTTIPIVFSTGVDPVQTGLVRSLNQPGGNATGVADVAVGLGSKRLGLLHELLPGAMRFALLVTPATTTGESTIAEVKSAAVAIGMQIEILTATTNLDIDAAFASLAQKRADALLVAPQILFSTRRVQLVTLAARHAVPTMYYQREYVEAGGLMSYGSSIIDRERLLGVYTGRILKGEKPAGPAHPAGGEVRVRHQPADSQDDRSGRAANAARPRRRGDRMMKRREFILLLGGAAGWPVAARAQQPERMRRIGVLVTAPAMVEEKRMASFRQGLGESGYIEGQNVLIEYLHADNQYERLPALAADLVRRQVNVIVTPNKRECCDGGQNRHHNQANHFQRHRGSSQNRTRGKSSAAGRQRDGGLLFQQ